ncbi:MaoC/PaaZ C-terminal domain-containing protein [Pseudonocardia lacus]|uniref:MaoC/PaaZ C-terminal domain-containing protein n=1 Tax=Pseudonocardia lacus TaxID=2835865 RepID=UPI001BDCC628|nr:MaoC/PaaZ C-terminal domain-containing protein [Pseudonocardia lacus]
MTGLAPLYLRAAVRPGRGDALPDRDLVRTGVPVDPEHLARYARVCGFGFDGALPATYPHVLGHPLQVALMVERAFPLPLPGLVHVRNTITQERPLAVGERIDLRVRAERLAAHPKGTTVDLVTTALVEGAPVWLGRSTYLARGAHPSGAGAQAAVSSPPGVEGGAPAAVWRVDAGTGRRYAGASGDVNPIHLHPLAARAFGFPRAIAHGMWTAARALAALRGRLSPAFTYDVGFAAPLLLPSTVELRTRAAAPGWDLDVRSRDGRAHLRAAVRPR